MHQNNSESYNRFTIGKQLRRNKRLRQADPTLTKIDTPPQLQEYIHYLTSRGVAINKLSFGLFKTKNNLTYPGLYGTPLLPTHPPSHRPHHHQRDPRLSPPRTPPHHPRRLLLRNQTHLPRTPPVLQQPVHLLLGRQDAPRLPPLRVPERPRLLVVPHDQKPPQGNRLPHLLG